MIDTLAKETSLKGVFVRNMLKKINESDDNETLKKALKIGLKNSGLSEDYVNLLEDITRNSANELMTATDRKSVV